MIQVTRDLGWREWLHFEGMLYSQTEKQAKSRSIIHRATLCESFRRWTKGRAWWHRQKLRVCPSQLDMHFGEDYLSNRCHHWQNHAGAWPNKNSFLSKIAWLPLRRLWNTREGYEDRQSNPLRKTSRNVASINNYFKSTVAKVKKQYDLKDASITNGPQGTISQKTQCSLGILT